MIFSAESCLAVAYINCKKKSDIKISDTIFSDIIFSDGFPLISDFSGGLYTRSELKLYFEDYTTTVNEENTQSWYDLVSI